MLSMANLSSSESLQQPWSNSQSRNHSQLKNNSHGAPAGKKGGGGGGGDMKRPTKHLCKKTRKSSVERQDYDDDQDHLEACFRDSDYGESRTLIRSANSCFNPGLKRPGGVQQHSRGV